MARRLLNPLGLLALGALVALAVTPVPTVAAARSTAAALTVSGVPWTWGGNGFGQLGDGTTTNRLTAAPVTGLDDVVDLHGGREHVIALRSDGTVWVWGSNREGQLGLGTTTNRPLPTRVPSLADVVAVETGHNYSMALRADGTVWTWGLNSDGQLGDGTTTLRRSPVQVVGLTDAVAIAAGRDMSYAIRVDGTVAGWGRNNEGQVGDGTTVRRLTPVRVGSLTEVVRIAGGRDHGLAVRSDGSAWTWGSNDYGQVGNGTQTDVLSPVQVATGVSDVAAGAHHSYALALDGTVLAWGRNYRAALGDGTTTLRTRPVAVRGVAGAVSLGSGRDTGMVVLADGRVMAWGHNTSGQVGDGTLVDRSLAIVVPGVSGAVHAAGGGAEYSVVLVGGAPPPNQDPVASFTSSCTLLSCSFDGSGSSDVDGFVASWAWTFGDGSEATGPTATHDFAGPGTYAVTLTVTDDDGAAANTSRQLTVEETPPATDINFVVARANDANVTQPAVVIPTGVAAGDRLVLFVTTNRAATATTPAGWTLLGTVSDGIDVRSWVFTRSATAADAGSTVRTTLDAISKTGMAVLAYRGAAGVTAAVSAFEPGTTATHFAPAAAVSTAGSTVLRYWADKTSTVHGWTLPAGVTGRAATTGSGGGLLAVTVGDTEEVPSGTTPAVAATAGLASAKAISWTVVLAPS